MQANLFISPLAQAAYDTVRARSRLDDARGRKVRWTGEVWFRHALGAAWDAFGHALGYPAADGGGPAATEEDLTAALTAPGVPPPAIRPDGDRQLATLEHIPFTYVSRLDRRGGERLLVAPYLPGFPFWDCWLDVSRPAARIPDLARALREFDLTVPLIRLACEAAQKDAAKESAAQAILDRTAQALADGSGPERISPADA
jgi:hypothetical protein